MLKLRKGMKVKVIAGKDRGKEGTIEAVLAERDRVVITGINVVKKSIKATSQTKQAGLVEMPAPIHMSNVMAVDPKGGQPTRVGFKVTGKGQKVRIAKKSGSEITTVGAK